MTKKYEDEVYNFFTQPENFETMVKVLVHSEKVLNQIVEKFWQLLRDKLISELKDPNWIVSFSDSWGSKVNKLMLYKKNWPSGKIPAVGIAFEEINFGQRPFLGVFVDNGSETIKSTELKDAIKMLPKLATFANDKNPWWPKWNFSSINTTTPEDLGNLIDNRLETSLDNAKHEIITLKALIEGELDALINQFSL